MYAYKSLTDRVAVSEAALQRPAGLLLSHPRQGDLGFVDPCVRVRREMRCHVDQNDFGSVLCVLAQVDAARAQLADMHAALAATQRGHAHLHR